MNNAAAGFAKAIADAKLAADAANAPQDGDYTSGGLLYCGKCHTPKQCLAPNPFGDPFLVGIRCQCAKEADRREEEAKQRERNEDLRRRAFDTAGMHEKTFANDDSQTPTLSTIARNYAEWIAGDDRTKWSGLLLFGDVDGGKSYAAAAVVNELTDRGIPCLMRTIISLANDLFKTDDKNAYLASLDRYRLLVLDDLGAERESAWMFETIYQIIDYRTRSGLPMIITANLTWDEIKEPHDKRNKRIYSRVMEACHPEEVKTAGRRSRSAAERYKRVREELRQPVTLSHDPEQHARSGTPTQEATQPRQHKELPPDGLTPTQYNDRRNTILGALGSPRET